MKKIKTRFNVNEIKNDLCSYTRGLIPTYRVWVVVKSIVEHANAILGMQCNTIVFSHKHDKFWWTWSNKEIIEVGKQIWEKTKTKPEREKHFNMLIELCKNAVKASERIINTDLGVLDNEQLVTLHKTFYDECKEAHAVLTLDVDAVDIEPVRKLNQMLRTELQSNGVVNEQEFNKIYSQLVAPIYTSFVSREEAEMLKLLLQLQNGGVGVDFIEDSNYYSVLITLIHNFWWTSLGWENMDVRDIDDYINSLKEYEKNCQNIIARIVLIESHDELIRAQREELFVKYNLSSEIKNRLEFFDTYAYIHDYRKEMQVRTVYGFHQFLKEFSCRLKIDVKILDNYNYDEIYDFLAGKKTINDSENKKRKTAQVLLTKYGEIEQYSGEEALTIINQLWDLKVENNLEISGVCSSSGNAIGMVKICSGAKEALEKIRKGDILVCGMTLPDYVPAMRKAAAIVTDEGGITCHAAIVARELKIPCITSAKIATQTLKDGMIVEVDADHSIVRIIKQPEV